MLSVPVAVGDLVFDVAMSGPQRGPLALLLHGFPQNNTEWSAVTALLNAAGIRTVAPNLRGYSPRARPAAVADYRAEELAADVVGLLDALAEPNAHLVAHDWGATVGWFAAGRYPSRITTYTALSIPHPQAYARALRDDPVQQQRSAYLQVYRRSGAARLLTDNRGAVLRRLFDGAGLTQAQVDAYLDPMLADPDLLDGALKYYRAMSLTKPTALGHIDIPTTYLWSPADFAVGPTAARNCAQWCRSDYTFGELPEATHWLAEEAPQQVAAAIEHRVRSRTP
ncbi:epoxide hydrolase [Mycolicibacterium murale]|uniref:Epoxide hydrolase n=2 Tax=Mycolicibacterium murale TaxID=182220 RepID=A0A7I9WTK2_9MYCO|nr:alpha/beta fold hydrolase [Mycolicibacterium murale]GFG60943.1 epoxide hydrolase [Mycolicibacterium murale]